MWLDKFEQVFFCTLGWHKRMIWRKGGNRKRAKWNTHSRVINLNPSWLEGHVVGCLDNDLFVVNSPGGLALVLLSPLSQAHYRSRWRHVATPAANTLELTLISLRRFSAVSQGDRSRPTSLVRAWAWAVPWVLLQGMAFSLELLSVLKLVQDFL